MEWYKCCYCLHFLKNLSKQPTFSSSFIKPSTSSVGIDIPVTCERPSLHAFSKTFLTDSGSFMALHSTYPEIFFILTNSFILDNGTYNSRQVYVVFYTFVHKKQRFQWICWHNTYQGIITSFCRTLLSLATLCLLDLSPPLRRRSDFVPTNSMLASGRFFRISSSHFDSTLLKVTISAQEKHRMKEFVFS